MMKKTIVNLVKVQEEDAPEIKNLMCDVYEDELKKWFSGKEDSLYIPGYDSIDMQMYHTWDQKYFKIMYEENILVGVILVSTTGREHGRIDRLYILPKYQGKGIGSAILAQIENMFHEVRLWTLDTTKFSPRNHYFYEKNGYVLEGEDEEERYYHKSIGDFQNDIQNYHVGVDYSTHNFRNCNFTKSDWYDLNLAESTYSNSNLEKVIIQNANMTASRFTNVNLSDAIIGDSKMTNAQICHCSMSNLYLHDINLNHVGNTSAKIERCQLGNSIIRDCDLKNIKIESCNLEGATIDGISVEDLLKCYKEHN